MSDLLARLIADGTSPALVAEVAMLIAEKQLAAKAIDDRRTKDRERQNRKRSRDVTECHVTERDVTENPSLSRPPLSSPQTPQQTPPTHTHPGLDSAPTRKAPPAKPRKDDPFPRPDWADPQVWADFLANRKRKNLPNTATAHAKLLRDIDALIDPEWPPGRLLEAIAARGWAAAYDPRDHNDRPPDRSTNRGNSAGHRRAQDERTPFQRECDQRIFAADLGFPG